MSPYTLSAIAYGKASIGTYRFAAAPLTGVTVIPESPFRGRTGELLAAEVSVQVLGGDFAAAYTEGDNRAVVATDTMKNFVLRQALAYPGATLEGFLDFLGRAFLDTYAHMEELVVSGRELPFAAALVPDGEGFAPSTVLFSRSCGDCGAAELHLERAGGGVAVRGLECARVGLALLKTTGSSFTSFARDAHTTLPEVHDRPLFIHLDVFWRYRDPQDALGGAARYVASEQVRDLVAVVFHEFNSRSIQHLVHELGARLLSRFDQLAEVRFEAQNRLWDKAFEEGGVSVRTDPRPPYGRIGLTLNRG